MRRLDEPVDLDPGIARVASPDCAIGMTIPISTVVATATNAMSLHVRTPCRSVVSIGRLLSRGAVVRHLSRGRSSSIAEEQPGEPSVIARGFRGEPGVVESASVFLLTEQVHDGRRAARFSLDGPAGARDWFGANVTCSN